MHCSLIARAYCCACATGLGGDAADAQRACAPYSAARSVVLEAVVRYVRRASSTATTIRRTEPPTENRTTLIGVLENRRRWCLLVASSTCTGSCAAQDRSTNTFA